MKLKCLRTSLHSDGSLRRTWIEHHAAVLNWNNSLQSLWVKLDPGVTGYESASVQDLLRPKRADTDAGWPACAGTPGSWDRLYVPPKEMERLRDLLALVEQPLTVANQKGANA